MAIIDVIKYQAQEDEFVWQFPSSDLRIGSQLVVNPSQHAFFLKDGVICDEFTSGTHTLKTDNIPLLNAFIKLPFGGNSPFQAQVWYVNLLAKLDNKWGTTTPIMLEDPKYGIIIPVRAFGQYGFKVANPRIFLETLVGNLPNYSATKIQEYFKGKIIQLLTIQITKKLALEKISILEINIYLEELSAFCQTNINEEFKKFGLEIINFYFLSINVPQDDPSVLKLKEAKDIVAKINITGRDLYQMDRSFDVLEKAAENANGSVGNLMGAGIGLSAGLNLGSQMGNVAGNMSTATNNNQPPPPPTPTLYYAVINGQQSGAFSFEQVGQAITETKIKRQTLLWKTGMEAWKAANEFAELSDYFNQTPPPPPPII